MFPPIAGLQQNTFC